MITALAAGASAVATVLLWLVVARLPEPDTDGEAKVSYRGMARPAAVGVTAAIAAGLSGLGAQIAPATVVPVWIGCVAPAVVLAAVDELSTWIPAVLCWAATLTVCIVTVLAVLWGMPWATVGNILGGGAAAYLLFWVVWRFSDAGFGYGDVRFAFLVGAGAVTVAGWSGWFVALLTGTVLCTARYIPRRRLTWLGPLSKFAREGQQLVPWAPTLAIGMAIAAIAH